MTKMKCSSLFLSVTRPIKIPNINSIEASRRLIEKYDFIVTSGGIGPTHDGKYNPNYHPIEKSLQYRSLDITYQSLAKSFNQPLQYHDETVRRLTEMTKDRPWVKQQNEEQRTATKRMALLPTGDLVEPLFVGEDTWVVSIYIYNLKSALY